MPAVQALLLCEHVIQNTHLQVTLPRMIILDHIHHVYSWVQRKRRPWASLTLMSRAWPISKLALVMCVALRIFLQTSEDLCKIGPEYCISCIWQLLVWQTKAEKRGDHYSLEQTSPESLHALIIEGNAKKCCRSAQQKPLCPLLWPLGLLGRPMNARPCTRHSFADRSRCSDELLWYVHYLLVNHFHSISVVG